jgi:hypothetical protein
MRLVASDALKLLRAVRSSPSGTATLDDSTPPELMRDKFRCGGKWRGLIPKQLDGILVAVGAERSRRKARNGGLLHRWQATSDGALDAGIFTFERRFALLSKPTDEGVPRQGMLF